MGKVISASLHSLNTSHQLVVNYYFIAFRTIQNHRLVEIGRDLWRWSCPISKDGDSTAFLFLLWVSLTVKKKFPKQFQFVATASAPLTGQHRKNPGSVLFAPSLQVIPLSLLSSPERDARGKSLLAAPTHLLVLRVSGNPGLPFPWIWVRLTGP